jgi:hypothetical protein
MSNMLSSNVSDSVRSAFDFSVDKFPLYGPDNMPTDQYGLFRSDTGYIDGIKSISTRYVPHTTDDVCALVDAASTLFDGEVECKTHWSKGHYVSIAPTRDRRRSIFGTADNIFPRVMIRGGFDGKGFHGTMGYYRDACDNLAMLRQVSGCTVSIRHTSGLRDRMNELIDTFHQLEEGWENMTVAAQQMQDRSVNLSEFMREVYADRVPTAEELLLHETKKQSAVTRFERMMETVMDRVVQERAATGRDAFQVGSPKIVSAWEAFNAVQGYVQHDAQSKKGFDSDFARILRAASDTHVHAAESLALGV